MLKFHNSLTGQIEDFIPLNPQKIGLYACGPTVYDHPHIGNARSAIVYDLLFKLLKEVYGKNQVIYVRNITDIDDKIITRAQELNISTTQLTIETTEIFHRNMEYLGCESPVYEPKATEHLPEMFELISKLLANNHAYIANNHVYFDVLSYPNYTNLSNRKLEEMIAGSRVEIEESKKNPADFVLWKPAQAEEIGYDSPFGFGRPGWHIECSAMSYRYLGQDFDIHGGGADLIFPHHTNEIAQSCCAFPGSHYAKFWVHNGFVTVNGEKMSKSLGNFITVTELAEQKIDGAAVRLALLSTHYRKPLDFNSKNLEDAVKSLTSFRRKLTEYQDIEAQYDEQLLSYLSNDLNIAETLSYMHSLARCDGKEAVSKLKYAMKILGIDYTTVIKLNKLSEEEIKAKIAERVLAKQQKDFAKADQIREYLKINDVIIEDTKDGTKFYRV